MTIPKNISFFDGEEGLDCINAASFRKCRLLKRVTLPKCIKSIGDAAFSYCTSLRNIIIPESVKFIGVAAYCGSGLEEVIFEGIPEVIEPAIFKDCKRLKRIVVPKGKKEFFCKALDINDDIIFESDDKNKNVKTSVGDTDKSDGKPLKKISFTYNQHDFKWSVGDSVLLEGLFSWPTALIGNPSYQFRRKALFVFLHSDIANQLGQSVEYEIPANVAHFMRKYQDKYSNRSPRIFLFVCDDGKAATFYDEVKLEKTNNNSITIKSLLRI